MITAAWRRFFALESSGGILLALAAVMALVISNSPWAGAYEAFLSVPGEVRVGQNGWALAKPLVVWVNDLWMAVFFFTVGLEIKREMLVGELATARKALLPACAALGGMVVPALIYVAINRGDGVALTGWAIPAATDIAFALGIMRLLGPRAPSSLKVFLTAVAIIDDLGAILIIAFFYTAELSQPMLLAAGLGCGALWVLNRSRVTALLPYVVVGLVVWLFVLKSGVHATVAGVLTALAVPMTRPGGGSPLVDAETVLHPWVAYLVLPMFAFTNAGVALSGLSLDVVTQAIPMGIALGLVLGKAVGVFGSAWLLVKFAGAEFPSGANRVQFFGMALLCGVGFTMSLFIGGLAFSGQGAHFELQLKLGVLGGSVVAALLGSFVLWSAQHRNRGRPYQ